MRLIGQDIIGRFMRKYPHSRRNLNAWVAIVRETNFTHHADLKKTFNSVDYKSPYVIFDISGNKFRLIARVDYGLRTVLVESVMTHSEYDRWSRK